MSPPPSVTAFRELHASGCFVIPNPWDVGSAIALQHLGFRALATTSAGFAFSQGLPDAVWALPLEKSLQHFRDLAAATPLPLSADFQSGYSRDLEGLARNVTLCVQTGVAGLSIEDATGDPARPLYPLEEAVERVRTARRAIDATGIPVVLTARCEAWLVGDPHAARTALERLPAFAAAGADCLFAPGARDLEMIASLVKAVAPRPLNAIVTAAGPDLSVSRLAGVGVRRISLGSALARVAWGSFLEAARSLAEAGSFDGLAGAATFAELNSLFAARAGVDQGARGAKR